MLKRGTFTHRYHGPALFEWTKLVSSPTVSVRDIAETCDEQSPDVVSLSKAVSKIKYLDIVGIEIF